MILLTKLDGTKFVLNANLIETIEQKPDTMVRLTTKSYYIVCESMMDIIDLTVNYGQKCNEKIGQPSPQDHE